MQVAMVIEGEGSLSNNGSITPLKKGETLLFPASMNNQTWETKSGQSLLLATLTHS